MKIAATEAQWDTCQPCAFSIFQIGGFTRERSDAELLDRDPEAALVPRHRLVEREGGLGMLDVQDKYRAQYGPGDYMPNSFATYWSMRIMAYLGTLVFLVSAVGAFLYRRRKLETTRWFQWVGVATIPLPFLAALAGWVLTEMGRQPWIVQGPAEDGDRELAERRLHDDLDQPRRVREPVRDPRDRRLRAHAALRAGLDPPEAIRDRGRRAAGA